MGSLKTYSKKLYTLEDSKKDAKRICSEQVSIDFKDCADKDPNYLKEFICKLKYASEGIPKTLKPQLAASIHKKTNSLTSAPSKLRDLTGYYVNNKKPKDTIRLNRVSQSGAHKGQANQTDISEIKPALVGSRSHASSLIKTIEKSFKHKSFTPQQTKDVSLNASCLDDPQASELAKPRFDKDKKSLLQGLVPRCKSPQDYKKVFTGISKKKNSESCNSVKLVDCRLTPQTRPNGQEVLEKSCSDI